MLSSIILQSLTVSYIGKHSNEPVCDESTETHEVSKFATSAASMHSGRRGRTGCSSCFDARDGRHGEARLTGCYPGLCLLGAWVDRQTLSTALDRGGDVSRRVYLRLQEVQSRKVTAGNNSKSHQSTVTATASEMDDAARR